MSVWKQLALSVIVLLVAAAAWVKFFPGAPEILASWGIDWAQNFAEETADKTGSTGKPRDKDGQRNRSAQPAPVITANVTLATINGKLSAIGTGRANNSVVVTPYSSGTPDRDRGDAREPGRGRQRHCAARFGYGRDRRRPRQDRARRRRSPSATA